MTQHSHEHDSHHKAYVYTEVHTAAHTCVTSQVNFQSAGFVILFITSRKGAGKELLFPEVGSIMRKQGTHRDERLLTAWMKKAQAQLSGQKSHSAAHTTDVLRQFTMNRQGKV